MGYSLFLSLKPHFLDVTHLSHMQTVVTRVFVDTGTDMTGRLASSDDHDL